MSTLSGGFAWDDYYFYTDHVTRSKHEEKLKVMMTYLYLFDPYFPHDTVSVNSGVGVRFDGESSEFDESSSGR